MVLLMSYVYIKREIVFLRWNHWLGSLFPLTVLDTGLHGGPTVHSSDEDLLSRVEILDFYVPESWSIL